jgi:hypothetical protein
VLCKVLALYSVIAVDEALTSWPEGRIIGIVAVLYYCEPVGELLDKKNNWLQ